MPWNPRWPVAFLVLAFALGGGVLLPPSLRGDEQERLKVGRQADGRIVVPTNQILMPAGKQVLFPGRPVDLALADEGRTLVVKNLKDLVFVDASTGEIKQTLTSPTGSGVVGLLARAGRVYATDAKDHLRLASCQEGGRYAWGDPVALKKPHVVGAAHPAGIARHSGEAVWVTSTRGSTVQLVNVSGGKVE